MRGWRASLARAIAARAIVAGVALVALAPASPGQVANPVYVDDSPSARDTLARVAEFVAAGNHGEAVRELQRLLEEQPDRVVASRDDPDLFYGVRAVVHRTLLSSPELLERYRQAEGPRARRDVEEGRHADAEAARLLTEAGFEAALRVAQEHLEAGRFEAARLTLEQLEPHPDRRGRAADDAALLMATVARYLDRPEVRQRAGRWAREAGAPAPPIEPVPRPAPLQVPTASLAEPAPALDIAEIPGDPLWSAGLSVGPAGPSADDPVGRPEADPGELAGLWVLPTVVGDTVYVNDGRWVSARDRFTLHPRWAVRPEQAAMDGPRSPTWGVRPETFGRQIEDTTSVSVGAAGRVVIATTGIAWSGVRDGDRRTHAFDAATGRRLWSVDVWTLDPQLDGATVRGPALVDFADGDTVVLAARKGAQGRRIVSLYLIGLDLRTGALRWLRPIASAGAPPLRNDVRVAAAGVLDRGVVYAPDQLGVIAAVEAHSGRPVWVRRMPVASDGSVDLNPPYVWNSPVPDGDGVVVLTPDRREVVRLDARDGRVLARRGAGILGDPLYLVRAGEYLAAVGPLRLAVVPLEDLGRGPVRLGRTLEAPGIRGRVIAAGDRLLVPTMAGLDVIDPANPAEPVRTLPLRATGNTLALSRQLLVLDEGQVHSFLTWEVAERLLRERLDADPGDPAPAVTYAELAYRTGHQDLIAEAADRALAAIERDPAAPQNRAERQRLFEALRAMVERSTAAPEEAPPPSGPRALELPMLAEVVRRLGRAADGHDQQVAHLMALGRLRELRAEPALAVEAYQQVLTQPALAAATWRGPGAAVRADLEATRRVRRMLLEHGPSVYAAFDLEAEQRERALDGRAAPEALERLARIYPASALAPRLWLRAADLHEAAGRPHAAVTALREGLLAAETSRAAGRPDEPAGAAPSLMGELAGRLVTQLEAHEQLFAAAQLVKRLHDEYPGLALTSRGATLEPARLGQDLGRRLAALERLPRLGERLGHEVQVLRGWTLLSPLGREHAGRAGEHVVMLSESRSEIALWGIPGAGRPGDPAGALEKLWSRPYETRPPVLLRLDPEAAYLYWPSVRGGSIERVDAITGETRWRTAHFTELFAADEAAQARLHEAIQRGERIETPLDGPVRPTDMLAVIDEQVVMLVERSGRAAAFDPASGRLLWTVRGPIGQVFDVDAGAGVVAIGGGVPTPDSRRGLAEPESMVVVYDARTGRPMHRLERLRAPVRWLRLAGDAGRGGRLAVGLDTEIIAVDAAEGTTAWSLSTDAARASLDAWVLGERLYVLDGLRRLWAIHIADGRVGDQPLETYEHLEVAGPIEATWMGGRVLFATPRGAAIFDEDGRLVGMDALDAEGGVLPPAPAESLLATLEATPIPDGTGRPVYALHLLDSTTGALRTTHRIVLWAAPRRLAVLDGRIVLTAGNVTLVLSAPQTDE